MADNDQKPVVTFLGPKASYTHQATLDAFPETTHTLTPVITIEDVFASVQAGTSWRGVVPFENSTNGSVVFTLDLFADLHAKYPDILVCAESYIGVQHCLLGRQALPDAGHHPHHGLGGVIESPLSSGAVTPTSKDPVPGKPRAAPLSDLSRIAKLYSHPQAWGQCQAFLNTYLKAVERQDVSSTSRAAELVARDETGTTAAISSGIAARIHGLDVLARGIQDSDDNTTRFFVLQKRTVEGEEAYSSADMPPPPPPPPSSSGLTSNADEDPGAADYKTLISFTVDHNNPGALAHSLAVFETYGLNLTSINTRPSGVQSWNYIFFVEIKGRKMHGDEEGAVNKALRDLGKVCRGWRWLGSWENRLVRHS